MANTAMARYEILLLAVPEIAADDASTVESQLHSAITAQKGDVLSFERWGKYRLAYQIQKNDYGVYFLARFILPQADLGLALEDIHRLFRVKYRDLIMRYIITELPTEKSLEYRRPESLEETPRREASEAGSLRRDRDDRRPAVAAEQSVPVVEEAAKVEEDVVDVEDQEEAGE